MCLYSHCSSFRGGAPSLGMMQGRWRSMIAGDSNCQHRGYSIRKDESEKRDIPAL